MAISPALIAAGVGAAGSIGSAIIGSNAAHDAAKQQTDAANAASQTRLKMYDQTRSDLQPYLNTGTSALQQLARMFGLGTGGPSNATANSSLLALQNYPGYQFGLNQGQQALDRSAASRGLVLSGAQLKDSQQFGQGYAEQTSWQPFISMLQQIAGMGQNAGAQAGTFGAQAAEGIAGSQLAAGQAQASGTVGGANAVLGGLQSGLSNALLAYNLYNNGPSNTGNPGSVSNAALALSDVRAKTDIHRVGRTDEGDNIYTFKYRGLPQTHMGVMAQEVERTHPEAVRTIGGLKHVDYSKLSPLAAAMKEAA